MRLAVATWIAALLVACSGATPASSIQPQEGVLLGPISGPTTESGGQATYSVALASKPASNVTLTLTSSNPAEGTVSPASLTFTSGNWSAAQTVTVTGVDDAVADGNQPYAVETSVSSSDPAYANLTVPKVPVVNVDNDRAGVSVSAASGPTFESGGQATFTLVLDSQPTSDVTLHFDTSNPAEGIPSQTRATFTAQTWSTPQTITVTGVDDAIADGNQPYAITFGATTSDDPSYAGITPARKASRIRTPGAATCSSPLSCRRLPPSRTA